LMETENSKETKAKEKKCCCCGREIERVRAGANPIKEI